MCPSQLSVILLVILVGIGIFLVMKAYQKEEYGQDASIRVSAGGLAGPMYGIDPISRYAEQIEAVEAQKEAYCSGCM